MARYDKYDPISGGFRAKLNATLTTDATTGEFGPRGVSLNASGRVVLGSGTGLVGLLVKNSAKQGLGSWSTSMAGLPNPAAPIGALAGDVVDIMTSGEIVGVTGFAAGDQIYALNTDGTLSIVPTGGTRVGWIVDAAIGRLVVRIAA